MSQRTERIERIMTQILFGQPGGWVKDQVDEWQLDRVYETASQIVHCVERKAREERERQNELVDALVACGEVLHESWEPVTVRP